MLMKAINKTLKPFGIKIVNDNDFNTYASSSTGRSYALFSYKKADGSFDYEQYRQTQEEGNKRKLDNIWAIEENIEFLAKYLKQRLNNIRFGLCHGTRRGKEQEWFKKYLEANAQVIGTEISDTATTFPNTIQWDFHETKPEWINNVDFIYSNSFDHSYDPEKCLNAWMSCLRSEGLCILEHTDAHSQKGANELDPFGADIVQMPYLITKWGKGNYGVREILRAPAKSANVDYVAFIIVQKY
jgi:hypothetical protein